MGLAAWGVAVLAWGVVLVACGPVLAPGVAWGVPGLGVACGVPCLGVVGVAAWGVVGLVAVWGVAGLGVACGVGLGAACGVAGFLSADGGGALAADGLAGGAALTGDGLAAGTAPFTLGPLKRNTLTSYPKHREGELIIGSVLHGTVASQVARACGTVHEVWHHSTLQNLIRQAKQVTRVHATDHIRSSRSCAGQFSCYLGQHRTTI